MNLRKITILFAIILPTALTTPTSEDHCASHIVLSDNNLMFTCDIERVIGNSTLVQSKCVHLHGFPMIDVCCEMSLGYKWDFSEKLHEPPLWLEYYNKNHGHSIEFMEIDVQNGWNYWNKTICADWHYGVKFVTENITNIQLSRFMLFVYPKDTSPMSKDQTGIIDVRVDVEVRHNICDPQVQNFGWMVTAIILMIFTLGSFILVISLSVTMPYNVWNKPKIQRLPARVPDSVMNL